MHKKECVIGYNERKRGDHMIATSEEMRKMDQRAVEEYQIPMHQLMKQAADAFFEALIDHYGRQAC